jgi:dCMP deaminase
MEWHEYFFEMCKLVSQKSKDIHTKAGCVIVGPDNGVRSTGFNGFPRGVIDKVTQPDYFSALATESAKKKDVEEQQKKVYERTQRPEKYIWTEHAERNAIYAAAKTGTPLDGCRIYVTGMPCYDCCRAIIQAGIKEVYLAKYDLDYITKNNEKYRFDAVQQMFSESGVVLKMRP